MLRNLPSFDSYTIACLVNCFRAILGTAPRDTRSGLIQRKGDVLETIRCVPIYRGACGVYLTKVVSQ